jgi:hypothetical protein
MRFLGSGLDDRQDSEGHADHAAGLMIAGWRPGRAERRRFVEQSKSARSRLPHV